MSPLPSSSVFGFESSSSQKSSGHSAHTILRMPPDFISGRRIQSEKNSTIRSSSSSTLSDCACLASEPMLSVDGVCPPRATPDTFQAS
jgi:hypothetical protein